MRAYRKARAWLLATPAAEVAKAEASFFPDVHPAALTATIATYQKLGNWTPHVEITRPAWEATVDIFLHSGLIKKRHRYEDVIAPAAMMEERVSRWLTRVREGARRRRRRCLEALFRPDAHWRDLLAFSWQVMTVSGARPIARCA